MPASVRIVPRPSSHPQSVAQCIALDWRCLLRVALVFGVLAWAGIELTRESGRVAAIWLGNAWLLTLLLRAPGRWSGMLGAAFGANVVANLLTGDGMSTALAMAACNSLEIGIAALGLRGHVKSLADLSTPRHALRFVVVAIALAPLAGALAASAWLAAYSGAPFFSSLATWYAADAMGMAIVAPLAFAAFAADEPGAPLRAHWPLLLLLAIAATVMFSQERFPYLFWTFPPMLFVVLRTGLRGAAAAVAIVAAIGLAFTLIGHGPLSAVATSPHEAVLMLQIFIACAILVAFPTAMMLAESARLARSLQASQERYRFLADNSRDIVLHSTVDGHPIYVSPSISELLGWSVEECLARRLDDWVHPDDAAQARATMASFATGSEGDSNIYRVRHRDGTYRWIETSSRVLRDPVTGAPAEFVSAIRDIDERMRAKLELERSNAQLQELALVDALTGLGNRRAFDEAVQREWRRAGRDGTSIALLLIDVDHFKLYNDRHGHAQGDACLREVALVIRDVVRSTGAVVTRYGGEEFAIILPAMSQAGAMETATRLRAAIEARGLVHERSPYGVVTACVGVACAAPSGADTFPNLFHQADTALYRGKGTGRNKVYAAEQSGASARAGTAARPRALGAAGRIG